MSDVEKIQQYIDRSQISIAIRNRYQLLGHEIFTLGELGLVDSCKAASLAYSYGFAKGYRAARAEAKRAATKAEKEREESQEM